MLLFIVSRNVGSLNQEAVCTLLPGRPLSLLPQCSGKSSAPGLKASLGREAGALPEATVRPCKTSNVLAGETGRRGWSLSEENRGSNTGRGAART